MKDTDPSVSENSKWTKDSALEFLKNLPLPEQLEFCEAAQAILASRAIAGIKREIGKMFPGIA